MDAVVELITSSLNFAADFIFALLEMNSRIMDKIVKSVIFLCQQLFYIIVTIFNVTSFAMNDLIIFLLEFGHGVLVILDIIINFILSILHIISKAYDSCLCVTFALYSLILSISKSLIKQLVLLAETLQNIVVLIVSSCTLFVKSVPMLVTMLFKGSLTLIMGTIQNAINNVFWSIGYIYNSFLYFMRNLCAIICDLPADFYIGSLLLCITYFLLKKLRQTYQRNGLPRHVLILPHLFASMIHNIVIKFHLYSQWIFSLFSCAQINEDSSGDLSGVSDIAEYSNASNSISNSMEAVISASTSSCYLQRKPLISLRNGMTDKENNEEQCELSTRTLKAELEKERDRHLCIVCQDKPKSIIILPCRHLCLCSTCYRNILVSTNVCPLCRHEIYDSMYVFF